MRHLIRNVFLLLLTLVMLAGCFGASTPGPVTTPPDDGSPVEEMSKLPDLLKIATPEQAENVFFSIVKIVKTTSDAVEAEPIKTPADERAHKVVKDAVNAFKAAARTAYPALERWRSLGDRTTWDREAPKFLAAALKVATEVK
jgi:hypothetical protein